MDIKELKQRVQWINWKPKEVDGKIKKVPLDPKTQRQASAIDPEIWCTYDLAVAINPRVGYVFTEEDGVVGTDIDNCIDAEGNLSPQATKIVKALNSYTEYSPSGEGLHILSLGSLVGKGFNNQDIGVEMYDRGRYFAFTGKHLEGTPKTLCPNPKGIKAAYDYFHPQGVEGAVLGTETLKSALSTTPVEDPWTLLAKGKWEGMGYPSQSEADLAFANHLRKVHAKDKGAASEAFRASGMYRDEHKLETAIEKAFEGVAERQRGRFVAMTEIEESLKGLEWAWQDWIPKGHVTMIVGATGLGKSYFAAALLAAVCGYGTWPDESSPTEIGDVFLTETENMKVEYAKRLRILGIDDSKGKVHFGPQLDVYETEQLDADGFALDLQAGFEEHRPKMLVIDSFSGAHDKKENEATMRKLMRTLTLWASKLNIPIVIVHHERKKDREAKAKTSIDRVRGSTTITQLCRSVIAIWREGEDDTVRIGIIKSNFAAPPPDLGMQIVGGRPKFVDPPQVVEKESAVSRAVDFLKDLLKDGAMLATEVQKAYEAAGHSKTTFNKARAQLRVKAYKVGEVWYNELRGEEVIKITGE